MNENRFFNFEEGKYIYKGSKGKIIIFGISGLLFLYLYFTAFKSFDEKIIKNSMLAISILMFVGAYAQTKFRLIIDPVRKEFTSIMGLFAKKSTFAISDFVSFEVHKVSYLGFITMNIQANAYFLQPNGKDKRVMLEQFMFGGSKNAQRLFEEVDSIFKHTQDNQS